MDNKINRNSSSSSGTPSQCIKMHTERYMDTQKSMLTPEIMHALKDGRSIYLYITVQLEVYEL